MSRKSAITLFSVVAGVTIWIGSAASLATETRYKFRECLASNRPVKECELTHYGR